MTSLCEVTTCDTQTDFTSVSQLGNGGYGVGDVNWIAKIGDHDSGANFDWHLSCDRREDDKNVPIAKIVVDPNLLKTVVVRDSRQSNYLRDGILIGDVNGELCTILARKD